MLSRTGCCTPRGWGTSRLGTRPASGHFGGQKQNEDRSVDPVWSLQTSSSTSWVIAAQSDSIWRFKGVARATALGGTKQGQHIVLQTYCTQRSQEPDPSRCAHPSALGPFPAAAACSFKASVSVWFHSLEPTSAQPCPDDRRTINWPRIPKTAGWRDQAELQQVRLWSVQLAFSSRLYSDFSQKHTHSTPLTCIGHGEAAGRVHHVHLRHQFGNILVLGQSKAKDLVLVGAGGEKASCGTQKHTFESFAGKRTSPGSCPVIVEPKLSPLILVFHRKTCPEVRSVGCLTTRRLKHPCLLQRWQVSFQTNKTDKRANREETAMDRVTLDWELLCSSPADGKAARRWQMTARWRPWNLKIWISAFAHTLQMLNRSQKNRYTLKPSRNVCSAFPADSPDADSFAPKVLEISTDA